MASMLPKLEFQGDSFRVQVSSDRENKKALCIQVLGSNSEMLRSYPFSRNTSQRTVMQIAQDIAHLSASQINQLPTESRELEKALENLKNSPKQQ